MAHRRYDRFCLLLLLLTFITAMGFAGCGSKSKLPDNKPSAADSAVTTAAGTTTAAETQAETEMTTTTEAAKTTAGETSSAAATVSETETEPAEVEIDTDSSQEYVEYRFRSKKLLNQHYEKHGREMGFRNAKEYEAAACDVINSPDALYKLEAEDGDGVYYIEETNEFAILSTDGYIRTYFNPNGGKAYFDRQ